MKNIIKNTKIILIIICLLGVSYISSNFVFNNRNKSFLEPMISFIVKYSLSDDCAGRHSCDELRPLPKNLQNKKIIFNDDVRVEFDSFDSFNGIDLSELDILGFIDTNSFSNGKEVTFVDPSLMVSGFLREKEYKIIRAVYSYKCSYCFDSENLSYIVLEDSHGNKLMTLLEDTDCSVSPYRDLSWDEYTPYFLSKGCYEEYIPGARLEDI